MAAPWARPHIGLLTGARPTLMVALTVVLCFFAAFATPAVADDSPRGSKLAARALGEASRALQCFPRDIRRDVTRGTLRAHEGESRERSLSPPRAAERFVAVAAFVENLALFKRWHFKQGAIADANDVRRARPFTTMRAHFVRTLPAASLPVVKLWG